jgi:hypothetical protein
MTVQTKTPRPQDHLGVRGIEIENPSRGPDRLEHEPSRGQGWGHLGQKSTQDR